MDSKRLAIVRVDAEVLEALLLPAGAKILRARTEIERLGGCFELVVEDDSLDLVHPGSQIPVKNVVHEVLETKSYFAP